jgi:hypothetical protein
MEEVFQKGFQTCLVLAEETEAEAEAEAEAER